MNANNSSNQDKCTSTLPTELEIRTEIANLRQALLEGPKAPNIWSFFSNKNRRLLTLVGDVTFIQAVLMEGDTQVRSYEIAATSDDDEGYGRNFLVEQVDGKTRWILCGRYRRLIKDQTPSQQKHIEKSRKKASEVGASFEIITERNFANRMTEFWNLATLCATITRARDQSIQIEHAIMLKSVNESTGVSIKTLLNSEKIDPSLMLAAVANALLKGYVYTDLKNVPINRNIVVYNKSTYTDQNDHTESFCEPAQQENNSKPLPDNRRTRKIPIGWKNLSLWPEPNAQAVTNADKYKSNKLAVEMYMHNRTDEEIFSESGVHEEWARKLFNKCIKQNPDGRINGFRPLIKYLHSKPYFRKAPWPKTNVHSANTAGFAGALGMLLRRFPNELIALFESAVLVNHNILKAKYPKFKLRASWISLRDEVHQFLRKQGVSDDEYPFNTVDQGYGAISALANSLLYCRPNQYIRSRSGVDAARHLEIGNGASSLIRANAPFQIMEADFHKHDSAATVNISTPTLGSIYAPVPRFWIGCIVDTFNKAIVGASDSFEKQTTISCVLDLIDSAIEPPDPDKNIMYARVTSDGNWLANQVVPDFAYHGWDILRLDRAWAHYSYDVIAGIISTVGCAVCFSKPRAWWARSVIERLFLDLTKKGAQSLPTTTGSNPRDTKKDRPDEKAIKLEFTRDQMCKISRTVIREINESGKQGAFWESPIDSLRRTNEMPSYFPRPVPLSRRVDRPTLWEMIKVKVESNYNHGIRPSIRTHHCRFRGEVLCESWELSGKEVWLAISRRNINNSKIFDVNNGRLIDHVVPDKQWRPYVMPWQMFRLIQKFGKRQCNNHRPPSSVNDFKNVTNEIVETTANSKISKDASSALDKVKAIEKMSESESTKSSSVEARAVHTNHDEGFGFKLLNNVFSPPPDIE